MKTFTKILIASAACAGIAGAAVAHNHDHHGADGPRAEPMLERMDTDGDGVVSREDARAFAAARFARVDADGDGTITRDERRSARRAMRGERIARMDANGDGMISAEEMRAVAVERADRRFARIDADGDGLATVAEIVRMRDGRGEGRRMHEERAMGAGREPVTQATMEERVLKRFARLDRDGDGTVTIGDIRRAD